MKYLILLVAGLLFGAEPYVEKLQNSAQVLREGKRLPLTKTMALKEGDEIITNAGSKAYLFFPNKARIKLGERSRFVIKKSEDGNSIYKAILEPLTGAFRYTADKLAKQHEIDFKVSTATIGIRGTDIWGKVRTDEAFVVLIEGNVSVRDGDQFLYLDRSTAVYDSVQQSVGSVDIKTLLEYAAETEITP